MKTKYVFIRSWHCVNFDLVHSIQLRVSLPLGLCSPYQHIFVKLVSWQASHTHTHKCAHSKPNTHISMQAVNHARFRKESSLISIFFSQESFFFNRRSWIQHPEQFIHSSCPHTNIKTASKLLPNSVTLFIHGFILYLLICRWVARLVPILPIVHRALIITWDVGVSL